MKHVNWQQLAADNEMEFEELMKEICTAAAAWMATALEEGGEDADAVSMGFPGYNLWLTRSNDEVTTDKVH